MSKKNFKNSKKHTKDRLNNKPELQKSNEFEENKLSECKSNECDFEFGGFDLIDIDDLYFDELDCEIQAEECDSDDFDTDELILADYDDSNDEQLNLSDTFYNHEDVIRFSDMSSKEKVEFIKNNETFLDFLHTENYLDEEVIKEIKNILEKLSDLSSDESTNNKKFNIDEERLNYLVSIPCIRKQVNKLQDAKKHFNKIYFDNKNLFDQVAKYIYLKEEGYFDNSNIISYLFVGSPGLGKSEFAKAFAEAVGLPFIYFNLSHNSIISFRGTNKQYTQSNIGIFMKEIIKSKVKNPIILLDEVDKAGQYENVKISDIISDILDPRSKFLDNFLEVNVDINECIFILTANNLNALPDYLQDRCNIIKFEPYSLNEKKHIIKNVILADLSKNFKILEKNFMLNDKIIDLLVSKIESIRKIKNFLSESITSYFYIKEFYNEDIDINKFILENLKNDDKIKNSKKLGFVN